MNTTKRKALGWILAIVGILLVLLAMFTAYMTFSRYVLVKGELYPRAAQLDLRGEMIDTEIFTRLQKKLPDSEILWDAPFQGVTFSSNSLLLEVTELAEQDLQQLQYFPQLQVLDGRACRDMDDIRVLAQAQQQNPHIQVLYNVTVSGVTYPQDTRAVDAACLTSDDVPKLECLPNLSDVSVSDCSDYVLLQQVKEQHPQWNLTYLVTLGGEKYRYDARTVSATAATAEELESAMTGLPNLNSLTLTNPEADGEFLVSLRDQYPDVEIRWELDIQGISYSDDLTEVDISHVPLESLEQAKRIGSYFPQLEKLIVDSGSIDNDTMAEFRETMRPDYKVVWTVIFDTDRYAPFEVRTDDIYFMPLKHNIYYFFDEDTYNLRYCEDMVCIDLGHMAITDVSFVEFMPHLKYLILAHTTVIDITPLNTCKELVFLELDWTAIKDYTPLLGCTALEDLNLGLTYGDPTPISQMTWLKNLWWKDAGYRTRLLLEENLPDTYLMLNPPYTVGWGWRELQNYYDMRDILGMPYML